MAEYSILGIKIGRPSTRLKKINNMRLRTVLTTMGFRTSVQRYLGIVWMAQLLYPNAAQYDVYAKVKEYFSLFYHWDIAQAQYNTLVANSLGKQ